MIQPHLQLKSAIPSQLPEAQPAAPNCHLSAGYVLNCMLRTTSRGCGDRKVPHPLTFYPRVSFKMTHPRQPNYGSVGLPEISNFSSKWPYPLSQIQPHFLWHLHMQYNTTDIVSHIKVQRITYSNYNLNSNYMQASNNVISTHVLYNISSQTYNIFFSFVNH